MQAKQTPNLPRRPWPFIISLTTGCNNGSEHGYLGKHFQLLRRGTRSHQCYSLDSLLLSRLSSWRPNQGVG